MSSKKKNDGFLKKVGHLIEEKPQEETPKEETPQEPPKPQSRNRALIIYIGLLFSVAFLFVLVSYIQQRNSAQNINQANQNASSALTHAEQLQDDNRRLQDDNRALLQENATLEDLVDDLKAQVKTQQDAVSAMTEAQNQAAADLAAAQADAQAAAEKARKVQEAYELLIAAQSCLDQELTKDFEEAMGKLEGMTDVFDEFGLAQYQVLTGYLQNNHE